jgi:hypothetical protein
MIDANATKIVRIDARHITTAELQQLGMTEIAYVKPVMLNGAAMFAIHGADGSPMAVAEDRDLALAAIVQHEMIPTLVH